MDVQRPQTSRSRADWTIVLPLKGGPAAKSRLAVLADDVSLLATAIALDTLDAVRTAGSVGRVLAVTADADLAKACLDLGADVVEQSQPDPGLPGGGLSGAIADGVSAAGGPCAVLLGDLPALLPADLDLALAAAASELRGPGASPMVFVPDAEGTGTVLLAAGSPGALSPRFGPGSAQAHRDAGATDLPLALPRLRRDVDTPADLEAVLALGAGPRTRRAVQAMAT